MRASNFLHLAGPGCCTPHAVNCTTPICVRQEKGVATCFGSSNPVQLFRCPFPRRPPSTALNTMTNHSFAGALSSGAPLRHPVCTGILVPTAPIHARSPLRSSAGCLDPCSICNRPPRGDAGESPCKPADHNTHHQLLTLSSLSRPTRICVPSPTSLLPTCFSSVAPSRILPENVLSGLRPFLGPSTITHQHTKAA
jgi:hypothetical protein